MDERISAYVAEVSAPGIPYVSTSLPTLRRLYDEYGMGLIDQLLAEHWKQLRERSPHGL